MTGTEIRTWIALGLLAVAAVAAVWGWLVNLPDGSRRYQARLVAFVSLWVVACMWLGRDIARHIWWGAALDLVTACVVYDHIGKNWKLLEICRRIERLRKAHLG